MEAFMSDKTNTLIPQESTIQVFTLELPYESGKYWRMKFLLTIFALVFSVMFSSTSFAEWTKLGQSTAGDTFYVDFEGMRKHDGYHFFWRITDYLKPDQWGDLSSKVYYQAECKSFRMRRLSSSYHTQPMGKGTPSDVNNTPKQEWVYPSPDSVAEFTLEQVCNRWIRHSKKNCT